MLCACSDLQGQGAVGGPTSSERFRTRGMEAAVRGVRAACAKPSCRQQESGLKVCEEQPGDKVSLLQPGRPTTSDLLHQEAAECLRAGWMCKTPGCTDPADLASFGEEEDDWSVKLKNYFSWWEPGHSENEYRNFPTDPGEDCVQQGAGQCAGVKEDPESSPTKLSGGRGSHAAEQNACLLHENGSDRSMYSCSSPTDRGGDDLELGSVVVSPGVV